MDSGTQIQNSNKKANLKKKTMKMKNIVDGRPRRSSERRRRTLSMVVGFDGYGDGLV